MTTIAQAWASALALHQAGQLAQAEQLYRQILRADPNHDGALHSLGVLAWQLGQPQAAADLIAQACERSPTNPEYQCNLAALRVGQHRWPEAEACCRRALQLRPNYAEAYHNLSLAQKGQGRLDEATASCRRALELRPDFAEAYCTLGANLTEQDELDEAIACLRRAVQLRPGYVDALNNLSGALARHQRYDEAAAVARQALQLRPDFPPALNNLGFALTRLGQFDEAVASLRRALEREPDQVFYLNNLATALVRQGRFDETLDCLRRTLQLKPDYAHAYNNLCVLHCRRGEPAEALEAAEQALRLDPRHADAHGNRSLLWLQRGDFERGWGEFEWGWKCGERKPWLRCDQPLWEGGSFAGRTLLVHAEQGLGDTIQFVRFLPLVKRHGGTVIFQCQPALRDLLAGLRGVDQLITQDDPLPAFDLHIPLLSVPRVVGTTLTTIPAAIPYLAVDPQRREYWRQELSRYPGCKVGVCWQGNPGLGHDRQRSVRLERFAALAALPGVTLFSVQKGHGAEQLARAEFPIIDLGGRCNDFSDTAAALVNFDLVISVDTSVAHLAGALGLPTWVLLPRGSDWRWLLDRDDSPWYPTARLFRQRVLDGWSEVFAALRTALAARLSTQAAVPAIDQPDAPVQSEAALALASKNEGDAWGRQRRWAEAANCYQQAVRLQPHNIAVYNFLGNALLEDRRPDEAVACFAEALRIEPHNPTLHSNYAYCLSREGRPVEAEKEIEEALRLRPDFADAWQNRAIILRALGRPEEALASSERALARQPDNPALHLFRSLVLLVLGRLEEGWREYEWRRFHKDAQFPAYRQPLWDGGLLGGRTLLVYAEQGLGDTLQFVRFLPLVKQRFRGQIVLECQPTLYELLLGSPGVDSLVTHGQPLPPFDVHVPLLSLPGLLGTTLATIPAPSPYLHADSRRVEYWRRELMEVHGRKVGIAWQGRPTHGEDRQRSVPLSRFAELADVEGVRLISLQQGAGAEQLATAEFPVIDLGQRLATMSDTAAVVANLDLVISVDTSLVHLAGALGKPAWVALPFAPDWRWLLGRDDSPWYPSLRLFRQTKVHDWDDVFSRLRAALDPNSALSAPKP